jgi:hypothetical protein
VNASLAPVRNTIDLLSTGREGGGWAGLASRNINPIH